MELIIKAYRIHDLDHIEEMNIKVTDENRLLVKGQLEIQYQKIVDTFKEMHRIGVIKSIWIPKNRKIQKEIDRLVATKKLIKVSLDKIKLGFE